MQFVFAHFNRSCSLKREFITNLNVLNNFGFWPLSSWQISYFDELMKCVDFRPECAKNQSKIKSVHDILRMSWMFWSLWGNLDKSERR
jgi:hypothetical protein